MQVYSLIMESMPGGEELARYPRTGGALLTISQCRAIIRRECRKRGGDNIAWICWQWRWTIQGYEPDKQTLAPFF